MTYDPGNVFARILRGELPCTEVCSDAFTLAFMDLMPQSEGHTLIITREPAATLFEVTPDGVAACMRTTRRVAIAVREAFAVPGVLIVQANGAAAGQTVPHLHFHVIPRRSGEGLRPHGGTPADAAQLAAHAQRIRRCLPPVT
jgi:histidine triad (HIT) family protein